MTWFQKFFGRWRERDERLYRLALVINWKLERLMATTEERFDALTARAVKILAEVQAVKQALADLRAAQGTLTPEQDAKLTAAEEALGRIDDENPDGQAP